MVFAVSLQQAPFAAAAAKFSNFSTMPEYSYQTPFPLAADSTKYRLLTREGVSVQRFGDKEVLLINPEVPKKLAQQALTDVNFMLRPAHLGKLRTILEDPEASDNDRFMADTLHKNPVIAAKGQLPSC